MNKHILNNNNLEVNAFHQFVNEEIEKDKYIKPSISILEIFLLKTPKIHHSFIRWIIKNQYGNNAQSYIDTIPLFFEFFKQSDTDICNDTATGETKSARRRINKVRKELLLYSAQLLQLIGKNRAKIITKGLLSYYKDEMKRADEYVKTHKLVRANGRIYRLVSVEKKQKQKIAQIINISKTVNRIAMIDNKFTYSLITLTLPPSFHINPVKGRNSFTGMKPCESQMHLMHYWKLIRAKFAKAGLYAGVDYMGLQTVEAHEDSTLHLHSLVYHSVENTKLIHDIVYSVAKNSEQYVKFDIKLNDGRASGSTYVLKYILKANQIYTEQDDNSLKNSACRFFYGARGFSFFGIKNTITQFNFLCDNFRSYASVLSDDIKTIFEKRDYYSYITKYCQYFDNVNQKVEGENIFIGVTFNMSGNKTDGDFPALKETILSRLHNYVLIEKKQYSIFETYEDFKNDIETIHELDLEDVKNLGVSYAFEHAQSKQEKQDNFIEDFKDLMLSKNINVLTLNTFDSVSFNSTYKYNQTLELHLFSIIQEKPEKPDKEPAITSLCHQNE